MLASGKQFVRVNVGVFDSPQSDYNPKYQYRWIDIDLWVDKFDTVRTDSVLCVNREQREHLQR